MKNKHESRMSHPNALWNIFMWFHEIEYILRDVLMALLRSLFSDNPIQTICCGYLLFSLTLPSSCVRNQIMIFFWESPLPRPRFLVRWPQCPTYSELIRMFSEICFSPIYSCQERERGAPFTLLSSWKNHISLQLMVLTPGFMEEALCTMMPTHGESWSSGNVYHHLKRTQAFNFPVAEANTFPFS